MKFLKSTLLMASAMFALSSYAQSEVDDTFVFVDKDGKEVPSGTTYTANIIEVVKGEEDEEGNVETYEQVVTGLSVKNTTDGKPAVGAVCTLTAIDNGLFQSCFPAACIPGIDKPGTLNLEPKVIEPNQVIDLQTEWIPDGDGSCTATFQLKLYDYYEKTKPFPTLVFEELETEYPMPSLTIKFVKGTTGINDILTVDNTKVVGIYTVDGKRVSAMQKGLNIVKLSDGKTLKVIK